MRIHYGRNDVAFDQGTFRVRGDSIEIFPAYAEQAIRIELWGDEVERISKINPLTGDTIAQLDQCAIYPAKHFVTQRPTIERAVKAIREELAVRLAELQERRQAARGAAAGVADHVSTSRCCWRSGTCAGDRELLPASEQSARGRAARLSDRLFPTRFPGRGRRVAREPPADRRACTTATGPAS